MTREFNFANELTSKVGILIYNDRIEQEWELSEKAKDYLFNFLKQAKEKDSLQFFTWFYPNHEIVRVIGQIFYKKEDDSMNRKMFVLSQEEQDVIVEAQKNIHFHNSYGGKNNE